MRITHSFIPSYSSEKDDSQLTDHFFPPADTHAPNASVDLDPAEKTSDLHRRQQDSDARLFALAPYPVRQSIFGKKMEQPSLAAMGREHVHELRFKERLRHFTWTWFTMTVSRSGVGGVERIGMVQ